ncbi:MAG: DegT/DnrJ/EryC1/StrS family aminotransferase [Flavobacteriales bacterium]|nr:DegT/DnrJ/EryC1/StrS family aminotransferase [Flavobacteriales bacterium]
MINIVSPFLPPIEDYNNYISGIWKRNWLTNNGPLVNELELQLKSYLQVDNIQYVTNGTIALQLAIKALNLSGEIITTPFSYIATTSSIVWEGCDPIFADIDPQTFNIDPSSISNKITKKTTAIIATHVYGNPCDIEAIQRIADQHNLKVIYDGAHSFGVKYKGESIFKFGDISTASFHATKLYHTTEGGAIFTKSGEILSKISYLKNFGHHGAERFIEPGINGKNSEFHAAMGLCNLKYVDEILRKRKLDYNYYSKNLSSLGLQFQQINQDSEYNYSYFPILFRTEQELIKVMNSLACDEIYTRRYFYPTLDKAEYLATVDDIPVAEDIAKRVLCLPLYYSLSIEEIDLVISSIKNATR